MITSAIFWFFVETEKISLVNISKQESLLPYHVEYTEYKPCGGVIAMVILAGSLYKKHSVFNDG